MLFFLFLAWRDLVVSCCLGSSSRETPGLAKEAQGLAREAQGLAREAQGLVREALWQRLATGLKLACNILQQTCGDIYVSILLHVQYIMPVWQNNHFFSTASTMYINLNNDCVAK